MPVWFQLYQQPNWNQTLHIIRRVERAGCPAIAVTIDSIAGGGTMETMLRAAARDPRDCASCHFGRSPGLGVGGDLERDTRRKPMVAEQAPGPRIRERWPPTWDYVRRVRDATKVKLFVKGIVTREDARIALRHGVDGIWVSNHGGRAENSGRATILSLPEVTALVAGRVPVIVDSGFRRGTDVFKGLALGATAVGVGRPYVWGLASFGQEGVETVLSLLRYELRTVMRQAGTASVKRIGRAFIVPREG
jgi:isopentenyl diphosphate isomerase/L-lactate dehydrogenase-like FMN-dependent dehydrogenase